LTTIYSELLAAAGTEFLPQAEGEPVEHYLRRLVLAVSKASDNDWDRLSKEAQDWYNAQAKRVKAHQDPEHCPGFLNPIVDAVVDAGWPLNPAMVGECGYPDVSATPKQGKVTVVTFLDGGTQSKDINPIRDPYPWKPQELECSNGHVKVVHPEEFGPVVPEKGVSVSVFTAAPSEDQDSPHALNPKHTATDAVRALVMLHTDWNQAQIMRELESQGRVVSLGTIATVRSMTLATIAVAKGLGKWVEG
jgi:hypothetical protein